MKSVAPFAVTVWGWGGYSTKIYSGFVSYAYPAGASIQPINEVVIPPSPNYSRRTPSSMARCDALSFGRRPYEKIRAATLLGKGAAASSVRKARCERATR
jgi:hypothetical protein